MKKRTRIFNKSALFSAMFLLVFVGSLAAQETPPAKTPREIVALWNTCYGTAEMDACGDITTAKMRDNKPKSLWVAETWKELHKLEFRKESSEVLEEKIDGDTALIVTQSRIYALDGYVDQKELFRLVNVNGVWLIDDLIVGDEVLEEKHEQS